MTEDEELAQAFLDKGRALGRLERDEEELAAYGRLLDRFAEAQEPDVFRIVARAWRTTVMGLYHLERYPRRSSRAMRSSSASRRWTRPAPIGSSARSSTRIWRCRAWSDARRPSQPLIRC